MDHTTRTLHWPFVVALLLILLIAAGLRLYRLPELPLGLHYDEAANGVLASEIAHGFKTPIFIPSYTGKEVLFFYWTALWMKLLGATPLALRLSAAMAGVFTVAATVWAVRELLYGQRGASWVALLTGAFLATSFWHLVLSRYGFRAVTQPLTQALTVAALWRGLRLAPGSGPAGGGTGNRTGKRRRSSSLWLLLAGLFCGLTAYTYLAARAFPIPLAAALLALLASDRDHRRTRLGQLALFVASAALTLAPLAHYWITHPGSFMTRTQQVAAQSWPAVWAGIRAGLGMFFLRGDPYVRFNLPHRPLLDPITAVLSLLGLIIIIWQLIRPPGPAGRSSPHPSAAPRAQSPCPLVPLSPCPLVPPSPRHSASLVFLLTYLPIMLLPSALATGEITPSNLRSVGLLPFIYVFPAIGLWLIKSRIPAPQRWSFIICHLSFVFLVLALLTPITARAYFRDWASSADLYYAADGDLADAADIFNQVDPAVTPYVASIHYRHPTLAFLVKDYQAIHWIGGGRTVAFPAQGEALVVYPHSASKDLDWVRSVLPDSSLVAAPPGPDGVPAFHAYRYGAAADVAPTHPLAANLGNVVQVLGYDVVGEPRSGESAEVAVWCQVLNEPDQGDYGPLARLADGWGFVWGEKQSFRYPSEQWTPGERIVDHMVIPVGAGAPPGDYAVHFSLYSTGADARLPVLDAAGRYAGRSVELPLRLGRATTPPDLDDLNIRTRLDTPSDGLTLLGVNLDTNTIRPGERVYATLFWQVDVPPLPDYDVHLALGDRSLYAGAPVHATYPTTEWTTDEVVVDRYDPRVPLDTPPGDYALKLWLHGLSTDSGQGPALDLGTVTVQATERTFEVPPISQPLTATLGGQVQLLGYSLAPETVAPGDTLALTLYWRALAEMDESYTVFTHLLATDGSLAGQQDNPPIGGKYPTNLWLIGEVVTDVYEIPVRSDAAPGVHRLEVGMYVVQTGTRLPVDGQPGKIVAGAPDDAVVLQTVTVTAP